MRIGTYNIRGMADDVAALARVVRAMDPDVLCVQEAPRLWRWRRRRAELAERTGLRIAAGRRLGGLAVYVRPGLAVPHQESHLLRIFLRREIRGLALAVVEVEGVRLAVASLHLGLVAVQRLHHVRQAVALVERAAARFGAVPVLCGDLNEREHEPSWRYLAARLADCYRVAPAGDGLTFTARAPAERIDAIFAGSALTVRRCGVVEAAREDLAAATDHLPVLAEFSVLVTR